MLDIKKIRNNSENVKKSLIRKDKDLSIDHILHLDNDLKALTTKLNDLQAEQNSKSKEVCILKSKC
jgi:seryl-tRNA synthetase